MKKFFLQISFYLFLLLFLDNHLYSQYWQKIINIPAPYTNNYWLDVYFHPANSNYGWICGFNGMIIRTTDGGNTWRGSIVSAYHLESVHFPTLQTGYVSGVEGIFKSTDGGATWVDITPPGARDTTTFWGCYFLNENYGVLVGDGCFGRYQHFWLTTDGGSSWSVFIGNETNSGMTDALLYPNGLGFASSSGRIWITQDSGRTWQVFSVSGSELWQEEITNIGSSFLVPYAGTTCTGGGNDGGMRFTTNNGTTWNSFRTGVPMFGSFLVDSQKGWACGYSQEVYYTSNGGVNWQRRNCGIERGNLDDLWFIDENNGWVVGEGVYKLANPKGVASKNSINFGEFCVGLRKYDTIWIKNYNFNDVTISLSLSSPTNEFEIVSPGATGYIQSCDSIRVVVAFVPKTTGAKNGSLTVQYPFQSPISIPLVGSAIQSTAKLMDTLIILNKVKCGLTYPITSIVKVDGSGEFVSSVFPISDNKFFRLLTNLPLQLSPSKENSLNFEVTPNDTGWQEVTYEVRFAPCDTSENLKIRVYAVSPIINIDSAIDIDFQCTIQPIKIRVFNSGNDTLFFRKFSFSPQTNKIVLSGWTSGKGLLENFILPSQSDTLIISLDSNFVGNVSTTLIIENNDFRSVRGPRNVVQVKINIRVFLPKIVLSTQSLDFGRICVGDTLSKLFSFSNKGNLEELFLTVSQRFKNIFIVSNPLPITVKSFDSTNVKIKFAPNRVGNFVDTLTFLSFNCKDTFRLVCIGEGVKSTVNYFPKQINLRIQKGQFRTQKIDFFTTSADTFKLLNYKVNGEINNLLTQANIIPDSSFFPSDTLSIDFTFQGKEKGKYSGTITFVLDGVCDTAIVIPVTIDVFEKNLVFEPAFIDFGEVLCSKTIQNKNIIVKNLTETADTILSISIFQKYGQFRFETNPTLPIVLYPYDSLVIKLLYEPMEIGYDTAFVQFLFEDTTRNFTITTIAFWGYSQISVKSKTVDFGRLEYCEFPKLSVVNVTNLGNVEDSIFVAKGFSNDIFTFQISKLDLEGNQKDSATVDITFINNNKTGDFTDTLILGFQRCETFDTIVVKGSFITPKFEILPNPIDFGEVWIGTAKTASLDIRNLFEDSFVITLTNAKISENVHIQSNFTELIQQNSRSQFNIVVDAKTEGEYWDTLCFTIKSKCDYLSCVILHYIIPKENYALTLKIGKYISKPDDIVDVLIENLTPNVLLKLDTLRLSITFDKFLFAPVSVKIASQNIEYQNDFGNLVLNLVNPQLDYFINEGKPIVISGRALYSFPDTTIFDLRVTEFSPPKEVSFNLIDGFLKVYPICEPIGAARLQEIPIFEIIGIVVDKDKTYLLVNSSDKQEISLQCFDLLGNNLDKTSKLLEKGLNILEVGNLFPKNIQRFEIYIIFTNGYLRKVAFIPLY